MPAINRMQVLQLMLLVFALPAQYLLIHWSGTHSEVTRSKLLQNLLTSGKYYKEVLFEPSKLMQWLFGEYKEFINRLKRIILLNKKAKGTISNQPKNRNGESIAKEVFKYRSANGYFGTDVEPRFPRPKFIKYRVGQVIKHKIHGYTGVIVGWDETCKAPKSWIDQMHGNKEHWCKMPNYSVLVDTKNSQLQSTYVVEENIEIITNTPIAHPFIYDYFDFFDGAQYHMRPALQEIYPQD